MAVATRGIGSLKFSPSAANTQAGSLRTRLRSRLVVLGLLAALSGGLQAQDSFEAQAAAIRTLVEQGHFPEARRQSTALITSGRELRLDTVEALGHDLLGRVLLENPATSATDRVEGIQELRLASRLFASAGDYGRVDSIRVRLLRIAGHDRPMPVRPADTTALDETALTAIVALQNQEIEALGDSQLRQLLRIQQQDLALDSFKFQILTDSLQILQQSMQLDEQLTINREEVQRRNFFLVLAIGVGVALVLLYLRYRSGQLYQERIRQARQRSDELLLNILPGSVARELKETGKATARRHPHATVMFSDFVGFSKLAGSREPEELVALLDRTFVAFDEITARHGLEKIKTIGDAYMCVSGVPEPAQDHADRAVRAALEVQAYLATVPEFAARIGIHSGPVVAGVVGRDKFAYDIWGDTVNQAARLEAAGQAGEVTLSRATCELLGPEFACERIGTFEAKNIGTLDRYRVRASRLTKNPS